MSFSTSFLLSFLQLQFWRSCSMQLHQWLAEKNPLFDDGLILLQEFGISKVKIDTIIKLKGTRLAISKMKEWLTPLSQNKPAIRKHYYSKDDEVKALDDTWRRNYKTAHHIFQTVIKPTKPEEEKRVAALEILDLFFEHVDPIWQDLKHFDKHGTLPETHYLTAPKEVSIVDKIKRRNTLRTYLSKFATDADKADKCLCWKKELAELEKKIEDANQ